MSVRASTSRPSTCSGDMYCTVPMIVPGVVRSAAVVCCTESAPMGGAAFARPKSSNCTIGAAEVLPPDQEYVARLEIAMHDPGAVRLVERRRRLRRDRE